MKRKLKTFPKPVIERFIKFIFNRNQLLPIITNKLLAFNSKLILCKMHVKNLKLFLNPTIY